MSRLLFMLLACACAARAMAQTSVFSPQADAVSLTLYRDGIALVTEKREVDLPAEPVTLVFQGVVDSLLAKSAVMEGANRPLAETNFSFDTLTPESLLERSVGKTVTLVRTDPRSGKVTRLEAVIVSAGEGVVFRATDGSEALQCSGLPERLEFSEVPGELNSKPTLSVKLAAGTPGKRTITVSYLAHGFSWSSDYVAHLNDAANRMNLTGWVTLRNDTNSDFRQAQVRVVAGKLNLLDSEEDGSAVPYDYDGDEDSIDDETGLPVTRADLLRARDEEDTADQVALLQRCFSTAARELPPRENRWLESRGGGEYYFRDSGSLEEVMVTGARVVREELGDYQLYRLPWATDLNARQTKQAVFLNKPRVKVDRFYSVRIDSFDATEAEPEGTPNLMLRWENKKSDGLGEPLPAGRVRIFEPYSGSDVFAGEAEIKDKPVGLPVEIAIARAMNLSSEYTLDERDRGPDSEDESDEDDPVWNVTVLASHRFVNNKGAAVSVEVRHAGQYGLSTPRVVESNVRAGRKYGELTWRFEVPAGSERLLRYQLRAAELD